jgi:hypothetical protein
MIFSKRMKIRMVKLKVDKTMHNKPKIVNLLVLVGVSLGRALALSEKLPLVLIRGDYA